MNECGINDRGLLKHSSPSCRVKDNRLEYLISKGFRTAFNPVYKPDTLPQC